ncbi:ribosomal L7Ae/L30e/S12e/Gadd45 family protein [Paenibacillus sp. N1-5-1-14]|uniref:ribosomal L7Ae/L30e/S12e/Gadd45 family protein n=1 Tax=Paenibacillus radicibacter TaxID=2972488 RepID=UPI002158A806|nr:ribosomal L7Ae/L30e/S12e/Gadd45 family protein [Paenibacillus radicibacter]MCR8645803.1 ribosomal L7Ae/L30e/S12e/Gadd45 family protein [Paenibacillus radicibacter]
MSYDKVKQAEKLSIGTKQATRSVELGIAKEVIIAKDTDSRLLNKITMLCQRMNVEITYVDSMKLLGKACGIDVGAAMVAIVNE